MFFSQDLTWQQREEQRKIERELEEEAKRKTEDKKKDGGGKGKYVVVGARGRRRLVRIELRVGEEEVP